MSRSTQPSSPRTLFLGSTETLTQTFMPGIGLQKGGEFNAQVLIDNGSGSAPTDNPVGSWQLWSSANGQDFSQVTSPAIDAELAKIAPAGNTLVSKWAVFTNVPGTEAKLLYVATSGGATTRARVFMVTG